MRNDNWGQIVTNAFGTHEFLDLCELTRAAPVICGNLGWATVQEMRDWVEYLIAPPGTIRADEGTLTVTLAHTDPEDSLAITLAGQPPDAKGHARILAADTLNAGNTPESPNRVATQTWHDFQFTGRTFTATLPPACIIALTCLA